MDCKAVNCPLVVEMLIKLITLVFATSITVEALDFDVVLGVQPGLKLLVAIEGLILHSDKVNLDIPNGNTTSNILLKDVLYAPSMGVTLVSISRIAPTGSTVISLVTTAESSITRNHYLGRSR